MSGPAANWSELTDRLVKVRDDVVILGMEAMLRSDDQDDELEERPGSAAG